ncbi:hypothetical protein CesoFtcFv8_021822 [Champsocephalus esox]|uniref:Disks large-associated protein 5 n=1 Tax=Champsocephalus esox TaxID=159716 RepID=A0AAN8BA15_9TELE|nr:hypothetical protein CesoFtcFv8_021822 [Champsocephalus esox]
MDSRFAHLRQRDASVSMLRVKMSRRRSQSQKENRQRAMNTRRQLDQLPEMEMSMSSLDASAAMANMSVIQEKTLNNAKSAKNMAGEERLKQLQRWKERKTLEKEKETREKERKGVFKTGLYHPKDGLSIAPLPSVPAGSTRSKGPLNTTASQSVRVTRSMKQQQPQVQKPLKMQNLNTATKKAQPAVERSTRSRVAPVKPAPAATKIKVCAVEPVVRAASIRSANRPPVTAPVVKGKPKGKPADARTTRSRVFVDHVAPPSDQEQNCRETDNTVEPAVFKVPEMQEPEEDMVVDPAPAHSMPAEGSHAFLTPSHSFVIPEVFAFNVEPEAELSGPSPPRTSPTMAPPTPGSLLETKHDVSYFRSEMSKETGALTALCVAWEPKVEDESIPEEMRDSIRTVVGQARLLMKQRFKQFGGLVDDCDLSRGEKITTCTDLQGFWDMVYYQVEDVYKKFEALKVAESQSWVEEHKPPPRQRKAVKKPSAAAAKPAGTKAAGAKSRLAAVKAAMKAKQQAAEAEKAAKDAGNDEEKPSLDSQGPKPEAEPQPAAQVVFDGGFFQVESPARPSGGSVRGSSRLSAAPQASPSSNYLTPRRFARGSLALSQTPVSTSPSLQTPAPLRLTLRETPAQTPRSQCGTPQAPRNRNEKVSLCFSPAKDVRSDGTRPEKSPAHPAASMQENTAAVPELNTPTPVRSLPSISVAMEQEEPSEAVDVDLPLSSRLSPSPCKTPLPVSHAPELSPSLSFMLSPCVTPSQPPVSPSPAVEASESACQTPDASVVEDIPGMDFERYLQPSLRCSLSPQATVAVETLSPMAVDVEMESPGGPSEDLPSQREPAGPGVSSMSFSSVTTDAESRA